MQQLQNDLNAHFLVHPAQEKAKCRAAFGRLRQLKPEIQHLQLLIEKGRKEMQQGFEVWHNMMMATHHAPQNEPLERCAAE